MAETSNTILEGWKWLSVDNPLLVLLVVGCLSLVPLLLLAVSSFVKISVVLNICRSAIGAGQVPSSSIIGLLSLVLSAHVMAPVFHDMLLVFYSESDLLRRELFTVDQSHQSSNVEIGGKKTGVMKGKEKVDREQQAVTTARQLELLIGLAKRAIIPLEVFLRRYTGMKEREFFARFPRGLPQVESGVVTGNKGVPLCGAAQETDEQRETGCSLAGEHLGSLITAFMLSELRQSFLIGFSVYLPFLVVDLVVASLLLGMGLTMLSPVVVSLPCKLILFVLADGWFLLAKGLVLSYQ